jgi:hypothetical protein
MQELSTEVRPRGWQPGQSGNPKGKPKGARHRATVMAEKLLGSDLPDVIKSVITAAKEGDMTAAKIIMDRLVPVRKGRPVRFELPSGIAGLGEAFAALVTAVSQGTLTTEEGASVAKLLELQRAAIETGELAERIAKLEARK